MRFRLADEPATAGELSEVKFEEDAYGRVDLGPCRPLSSRALWVHHSSGQNRKELAIGNDLGRRGSLLVPPHKPHSIGCCDAQSTSATGRCCRKSPRHPTARNNRIIGLDFLNRTCAFETHFESMLLGEPSKIVFRQHRPDSANLGSAASRRLSGVYRTYSQRHREGSP